jgi:hypothetical protein
MVAGKCRVIQSIEKEYFHKRMIILFVYSSAFYWVSSLCQEPTVLRLTHTARLRGAHRLMGEIIM